ncbi:MAG: hypothetical protein WC002_01540 [Candidatus Muiribacteriota bacterium]
MNCPRCGNVFEGEVILCPSCKDYFQVLNKAEFKKRIIAGFIDSAIVFLLFYLHFLTAVFAPFYILFRDIATRNGSVGKFVTALSIVDLNKRVRADFRQRVGRNFFLAVGSMAIVLTAMFEFIPVAGLLFKFLRYGSFGFFMCFIALEIVYIFNDEKGQRLTEKLSNTMIV